MTTAGAAGGSPSSAVYIALAILLAALPVLGFTYETIMAATDT